MEAPKPPSSSAESAPGPSDAPSSATPAPGPLFTCELTAAPSYPVGTPVKLHFRLTQRGTQTVYVLNWRTPLEGLRGDDFAVVRDGQEVPYRGPMMKRGNPGAESYLALEAGKALEADVDISRVYDFKSPGRYRITFRGPILDATTQQAEVPRPLDKHQSVPVTCTVDTEITPSK